MNDSTIAVIILACVLVSFALNKISIGLTAMLGALAMAVFGVMDFSDVYVNFGSSTVMMVFGVTVIGNTMFETGCAQLLGKSIVRIKLIGNNERVFIVLILLITCCLSAFVSNTATVAMMIPVINSIASASDGKITRKNTLMAMAIASIIGGNVTLAGSTPQLVAQGILEQTEGVRTLGFFELAKGTIPLIILLIIYFTTFGYSLQKRVFNFPDVVNIGTRGETDHAQSKVKIVISGLIFLGCIVGFTSGWADFGIVALIGAFLCVLTGCISPQRLWATIDWKTLTVLGGSLGFATGVTKSGAVELLTNKALELLGGQGASVYAVCALILTACAAISCIMSNTATAAIFTPFAISIGQSMGLDPIPFVIMVVVGSNLAFATPISTPPITMVLVGGYRFSDYVKVGGVFNILAVLVALITIPMLYGLV